MRVHVSVNGDVSDHTCTSKRYEKIELFRHPDFPYTKPLQVVVSVSYPN